ncbi:MAG: copper chaperone PCu(A)C [Anaerolineae bacterium]|nr:copper chaperone PCu(A)C [Anaerolineae bacterium]
MLIDLQQPLVEGETFELTLRFQSGLELVVPVAVEAR